MIGGFSFNPLVYTNVAKTTYPGVTATVAAGGGLGSFVEISSNIGTRPWLILGIVEFPTSDISVSTGRRIRLAVGASGLETPIYDIRHVVSRDSNYAGVYSLLSTPVYVPAGSRLAVQIGTGASQTSTIMLIYIEV